MKVESMNLTYEDLVPRIQKSFLSKDVDALHPAQRGRPVLQDQGDHRPRAGRGPRRRADRVRRYPGRPGGGELDADRRAPGGIRR